MRGPTHKWYKTGKSITRLGYVMTTEHEHPRAAKTKKLFEHIRIAERALGKPLPSKAVIHHVDGNPQNNLPSNLIICQDQKYHMLLESRTRRLKDTGDLSLKRCGICDVIKPLNAFARNSKSWDGHWMYCRPCNSNYRRIYLSNRK